MNNLANAFRLFADAEFRGAFIGILAERAGIIIIGAVIFFVGMAFVLAETKAAATVKGVANLAVDLVATKGAGTVSKVAKTVS